jgi:hypothetical protein
MDEVEATRAKEQPWLALLRKKFKANRTLEQNPA